MMGMMGMMIGDDDDYHNNVCDDDDDDIEVEGARKLPPTCTHGAVVVGTGWVCNQVGLPKPVG